MDGGVDQVTLRCLDLANLQAPQGDVGKDRPLLAIGLCSLRPAGCTLRHCFEFRSDKACADLGAVSGCFILFAHRHASDFWMVAKMRTATVRARCELKALFAQTESCGCLGFNGIVGAGGSELERRLPVRIRFD